MDTGLSRMAELCGARLVGAADGPIFRPVISSTEEFLDQSGEDLKTGSGQSISTRGVRSLQSSAGSKTVRQLKFRYDAWE